ncbi:hypothetical protein AaE_006812, partial [Aphanomyces astaci]
MQVLAPSDSPFQYEAARAKHIAPFLQQSDLVLDLHSTNKPSVPFLKLAGQLTPEHASVSRYVHVSNKLNPMDGYVNMCRWFHCDVLLHDPNYQLAGGIALTDEYTGAHGGVGIIFESGEAGDTSRMAAVADAVLRILTHEMAMLPVDTAMPPPPSQPTAFEITE